VTNLAKRFTAVALGVLLVAGCGGGGKKDNGLDKLSGSAALAKVKAAAATVKSVHVHGSFAQGGKSLGIDLHIKKDAGVGRLSLDGGTLDVVRIGSTSYFRGDATALQASGASAAQAALVAGKWIKGSSSSGAFQAFSSFLDLTQLMNNILDPSGSVTVGDTSTVNDVKTVALVDNGSSGGTLYIALQGKPLPVKIVNTGSSGGTATFDQYDQDVTVKAPSGAVDLSQLVGQ
jgi:hypothetical protein